jgi:hypothetical protein
MEGARDTSHSALCAFGTPVQVKIEPLHPESATSSDSSSTQAGADGITAQEAGVATGGTDEATTVSAPVSMPSAPTLADMMTAAGRLGQESPCSKHSKLLLCGLLAFAIEHHTHRIKYFLVRQNVAVKVMRLVYYPERHMQLAGVRFLRALMTNNDAFYHRYMARLSLFGHVFWALAANGQMSNLVNSSVLESLHFVAQENVETLIKDLTNKYSTVLREIMYSRAPAAILRKAKQLARGQALTSADVGGTLGDYGAVSDEPDSDGPPPPMGTSAAMRASRGTALSSGTAVGSGLSATRTLFGRGSLLARSALHRPALGSGGGRQFDVDDDGDSDLGDATVCDHSDGDGDGTPTLEESSGADLLADLEGTEGLPQIASSSGSRAAAQISDEQLGQLVASALRREADDDSDEEEAPFGRSALKGVKGGCLPAAPSKAIPSALAVQSIFSHVASGTVTSASLSPAGTTGIMAGPPPDESTCHTQPVRDVDVTPGGGADAAPPVLPVGVSLVDYGADTA